MPGGLSGHAQEAPAGGPWLRCFAVLSAFAVRAYADQARREEAVTQYEQIAKDHAESVVAPQALYYAAFGSLELVRDQIRIRGLQSILLVSDPYHSLRIRLSAQELGLTAYVSPTRTSPVTGWAALWREMKEAAGVAIGWLIGFRRLLRLTG